MIKLPVTANIPASLPVAPTLPSLAYKNSSSKRAPTALSKPGQWLWALTEGPGTGQQAPQRGCPLYPSAFCSLGGLNTQRPPSCPQMLATRQNGEGEGLDQSRAQRIGAEELLSCSYCFLPLTQQFLPRKITRGHLQNPWLKQCQSYS